jgi:hypothetical protein
MFKKSITILITYIIILTPLVLFSQNLCQGKFENKTTIPSKDLPNISLRLLKNGFIVKFKQTNPLEKFSMSDFENGIYNLYVAGDFFKSWDTTLSFKGDTISNIVIPLFPLLSHLDTVKISTKKNPFFKRGDTIVFNAKEYRRGTEKNLKELINNLPGTNVTNGTIYIYGKQVERLLLEGKDLTGEDYSKVVNNLSAINVKEIQLIQNYKDKFKLSYNIGDSMLAMNISFNKKRGLITTARIGVGFGLPNKFYELNADILGDYKKLTFLTLGNSNNHGNSLEQLTNGNNSYYTYLGFNNLRAREVNRFLNPVREPYLLGLEKNNYLFNNTNLIDISTEYKLSKTAKTKNIFAWSPEKLSIFKNETSQSFLGDSIFSSRISESNSKIKSSLFLWKNETVKMFSNRSQVIFKLKYIVKNKKGDGLENINSINRELKPENKNNFLSTFLEYNYLPSKKSRFSTYFFYESEKLIESLFSEGISFKSVFLPIDSGEVSKVVQRGSQQQNQVGVQVEFSKLFSSKSQMLVSLAIKKSLGNFSNQVNVKSLTITNLLIDSFTQSIPISRTNLDFNSSFTKWLGNWYISTSVNPFFLPTQRVGNLLYKNEVNWNGKLELAKLFENNRLGVTLNKEAQYPNSTYYEIPIVANLNNIYKVTNQFFPRENTLIFNLYFRSNNIYGNNSKYNLSFNFIKRNENYLANTIANNFYTIESVLLRKTITNNFNLSLSSFFKLKNLNIIYEPKLSINYSKFPISQNDKFVFSKSNLIEFNQGFKKIGLHKMNFNLENSITKSIFYNEDVKSFSTLNSISKLSFDYLLKKNISISTQLQNVFIHNSKTQNFYLLNTSLDYRPISKLSIMFEIKNVFNSKFYILQYSSPTFIGVYKTKLLPLHGFLKLDYNF